MKTPFLTTTFSEKGKQAKHRFSNILNTNKKKRGTLALAEVLVLTLICGALVGCESASIGIIGGADGPTAIFVSDGNANDAAKLENAISEAVMQHSEGMYLKGVFAAEGHVLLGTEDTESGVKVYAICSYNEYDFCGDHFEVISGCGAVPTVITFDEAYNVISYEETADGHAYEDSVRALFPQAYHARILDTLTDEYEICEAQKLSYAQAYLDSIDSDAEIGDYADFH